MGTKWFRVDLGKKLREDRQLARIFLKKTLLSKRKNKAETSLVGLDSSRVRTLKIRKVHVHGSWVRDIGKHHSMQGHSA